MPTISQEEDNSARLEDREESRSSSKKGKSIEIENAENRNELLDIFTW